jgi:ribonuclease Y
MILLIITGAAALLLGLVAGWLIFSKNTKKRIEEAEELAEKIVKEAELRAETVKKETAEVGV